MNPVPEPHSFDVLRAAEDQAVDARRRVVLGQAQPDGTPGSADASERDLPRVGQSAQ